MMEDIAHQKLMFVASYIKIFKKCDKKDNLDNVFEALNG